jgi:hypothetical protein
MGREIRRVPPGWQHPRYSNGRYKPLYDKTYADALAEWKRDKKLWEQGKDPVQAKGNAPACFEEWYGGPPDIDYYRDEFDGEPTHYQIYENVSEGTPVSPVFASLDEMKQWLMDNGHSEYVATRFCELGYAPSMVFMPERGPSPVGIHSLDWLKNDTPDQR